MDIWVLLLISLCLCIFVQAFFQIHALIFSPSNSNLPPGPPKLPIITRLLWLRKSPMEFRSTLCNLHSKYGPIITVFIGPNPSFFISDRSIAHKALIQNGALFADRPPPLPISNFINSTLLNINSASYGPIWRLLRRNLTSEILNPSRVKSYTHARKWVLDILFDRLLSQSQSGTSVCVVDHFQYAMFCLLVLMCFGDKLGENQIKEIEDVQRGLLLGFRRFSILNFWPRLTKIIFRKRLLEFFEMKNKQASVLFPLIEARKIARQETLSKAKDDEQNKGEEFVSSYVDTLLDLELPEEKRKLNKDEIISLCSEFLNAGTDTTSTALQWVMANIVKYPEIQEKLYEEIKGVVGTEAKEVKEEDLGKLPYLKAVVLEGLRRHPPAHFVLPHAVREDTTFEGFTIPKKGRLNFMVAEMGRDPNVWEDPMEFKPERFVNGEFDITGSKEIKMMPFGAGRRICPGIGLAMLHLEYFVGNLVWGFEWKTVDGDDVDLSEKPEFTTVMEKPLMARINSRF